VNKYCEGKMKRTYYWEWKDLEINKWWLPKYVKVRMGYLLH